MPRSRVIIELTPSTLTVAACRGRNVIDSRYRRFDRGEWPASWTSTLEESRGVLSTLVAELGCIGAACDVIYHTPGAVVGVSSCAQAAGASAALNAASLQLASVASFPLTSNPSMARELFQDSPTRANTSGSQLHTIAAADSDENIGVLTRWVESAGLRVESLTPYEAAATVAAVNCKSACSLHDDAIIASVWMGADLGILTVGTRSKLHFVRTLGLGTESLIDAMMKPIRSVTHTGEGGHDEGAVEVVLTREQARSLLRDVGIPTPQQPLPGLTSVFGAAVLPALQPCLQRLAVEIKQSLRFGVSEEERAAVRLNICGPGAAVPNLGPALARLAGCQPNEPSPTEAAAAAELHDWADIVDRLPRLVGVAAGDRIAIRTARRALGIGVGVAAAFLIFNGFSARAQLGRENERLAAVKSQQGGDAALEKIQQVSTEAKQAADSLLNRVANRMGESPRWGAVLAAISSSAPTAIRLSAIEMAGAEPSGPTGATCVLHGHVQLKTTDDPVSAIRTFSKALEQIPLVTNVKLGSTLRTTVKGEDAQTFELTLSLVGVPFDPAMQQAGAARSEQP